jgi:rSAM/selenodomain-associated transferase 1
MRFLNHLVVFARAPGMGRAKRRLAAGIGPVLADGFQRDNLARLLRELKGDGRWRLVLAVTPDGAAGRGAGDLGRRMSRVMRRLGPGPVVIIGSDIPGIRRHHVARAFRALGDHDAVFGPSVDGGYWLVGLKRRPRVAEIFGNVRWSSPHALADTQANLAAGKKIAMLECLADIDEAEAYWRWRGAESH